MQFLKIAFSGVEAPPARLRHIKAEPVHGGEAAAQLRFCAITAPSGIGVGEVGAVGVTPSAGTCRRGRCSTPTLYPRSGSEQ